MKVETQVSVFRAATSGLGRWEPQSLRGLLCLVTNHLTEGGEPFLGVILMGLPGFLLKTAAHSIAKEKYITIEKRKKNLNINIR